MPTYNRAGLIVKAIESVLAQSFDNWELIIIDDGSTDNTGDVVKQFADPRIKYFYQANAERCAARNNGIKYAAGMYVCFLDSDDYYLPERLSLLYTEIVKRNCPVEMFYTGVLIDKEGKVNRYSSHFVPGNNVFDNLAQGNIGCPQACISRQVLIEFKYDTRFRISEDMELWLRIAKKYPVTYLDNQYTFVAVEHDERSVNAYRNNVGAEQLKVFRFVFSNTHSGKQISKSIQAFMLGGAYQAVSKYYIYQGKRLAAIKASFNAVYTDRHSAWVKFRTNILFKLITLTPMDEIRKLIEVG